MKNCPNCKSAEKIRNSPRRGFLERGILHVLLLRPYHCESCGIRFYGFQFGKQFEPQPEATKITEELASTFLTPQDTRDFEQLIGEIREGERKMGIREDKPKNR